MYIVPIVQSEINISSNKNLIKCILLLDRNGTSLISLDKNQTADSFCKQNDICMIDTALECGDIVFVNVDKDRTDMDSFYKWSEILPNTLPMKEVWRHFVWNKDVDDKWGTNIHLHSIDCGNKYTIGKVLDAYFKN
jgi:hypothetical protein